ncbi:50S ribosomal protein L3 N(5)-glutamine methyltransferase [Pelistega indica]|uniref:50S ribosomal protein L3 N(5)-glutamine methyltransferase n=1 Tax=Pelistega indica TaxID=1414851 RepID=UPI000425286E|nr:50S ribosomal protein L3 N(5)-glutamine methyltransferase [Pelistega indica]
MSSTENFEELTTIRDVIRYAVSQFNEHKLFFGHGSDNAWDEAVYLTLFALNLPLDELDVYIDAHILKKERKRCLDLIHERVKKRVPLAYLTGEAWLQGYRFIVDKHVIVPRSPISELLGQQLSPWVINPDARLNILDMCTGSANLAILAAINFPHAHVDAVDVSEKALKVAKQNVELYQFAHQVSLYQSDLFTDLPEKQYDIIICNPPYVNETSMQALPEEYQNEPKMALTGGEDGMDLIRKILHDAPRYLRDEALLSWKLVMNMKTS